MKDLTIQGKPKEDILYVLFKVHGFGQTFYNRHIVYVNKDIEQECKASNQEILEEQQCLG